MSHPRRKVYKANDGSCNTKKRLPGAKPAHPRNRARPAFVARRRHYVCVRVKRPGNVDLDARLLHNASSRGSGEISTMRAFKRSRIVVPLISVVAAFAFSAQAQEQQQHKPPPQGQAKPVAPAVRQGPPRGGQGPAVQGQAMHGPQGPQGQRVVRGNFPARNFGGRPYRGRLAWEGGRWRHEMHNGRFGWWWDVGGAWYFYPQPMDGPPAYVSDVEVMDDVAGGPDDDVGPGPGYPPPAAAYAPPPPPPGPDPAASAVGGAIVGGVLGGLISGRPVGAAVGAITGGTIGAIAGAQAAARPGYYLAQGGCYYKYPSGQYAQVDPRNCY